MNFDSATMKFHNHYHTNVYKMIQQRIMILQKFIYDTESLFTPASDRAWISFAPWFKYYNFFQKFFFKSIFIKLKFFEILLQNLDNYFRLHVYLSFYLNVRTSQSAVISQNGTNESCLVCVKSKKCTFWITLRPLRSMRGGKAELSRLQY